MVITFGQENVPPQSKGRLPKSAEATAYCLDCTLSQTTGRTFHLLEEAHTLVVQREQVEREGKGVVSHHQRDLTKAPEELHRLDVLVAACLTEAYLKPATWREQAVGLRDQPPH